MIRGIDYIGVGVGAAIFNDKGQILITKRGPKAKNERGLWEIPGGSVEFGETFREALIREIREELGVEIVVHQLLDICDHIIPDEHQHWVSPTYICSITKGVPKILEPDKCEEIAWCSIKEIEQRNLPLSIVTAHDVSEIKKQYPKGIYFSK